MEEKKDSIFKYQPLWGNWYVDCLIGKGSYGSVYRVYREDMGQTYISAVKIITIPTEEQYKEAETSMGSDEETLTSYFEDAVKNIVKEVNVLHSLSGNTNIIGYHDHCIVRKDNQIGWDILIRMEYVTSLRAYMKENRLTREEAVRLGIDICTALELCSKKGIIHRDIKDDNIFINENGAFKLGDFGIARELSKSGRAASMRGTPMYMAPEVFRGDKYYASADIYSLGLVLYRLLNDGRMPFMPPWPQKILFGDSDAALDRRIQGEALPQPSRASERLGRIILKACAFDAGDRYDSATALKRDLEQVLSALTDEERQEFVTPLFHPYDPSGTDSSSSVKTDPAAAASAPSADTGAAATEETKGLFTRTVYGKGDISALPAAPAPQAGLAGREDGPGAAEPPQIKKKGKPWRKHFWAACVAFAAVGCLAAVVYALQSNGSFNVSGSRMEQPTTSIFQSLTPTAGMADAALLTAEPTPRPTVAIGFPRTRPSIGNVMISAGYSHIVGLKSDGTCVATGTNSYGECNVSKEKGFFNLVAVVAGDCYTIGLKTDGTCVAVGWNDSGQCNVTAKNGFTDIVAILAGYDCTYGLKADGTWVAAGNDVVTKADGFTDIAMISGERYHTVFLNSEGKCFSVGSNDFGESNVSDSNGFSNAVAISAGRNHTVCLKSDGTCAAVGINNWGQCDVTTKNGFKDVKSISAGYFFTVGSKTDGTCVAIGDNSDGQCNVSAANGFYGLSEVSAGMTFTVGLKSDGTCVAVGNNDNGQCNIQNWKLK